MPIQDITENQFFDMFNLGDAPADVQENDFGLNDVNADIFNTPAPAVVPPVEEPKKTEEAPKLEEEVDPNAEVDIFQHDEDAKKAGRKPKYDFSDTSGYFENRIKAGKFVGVEEEVNGEVKPFIPKTPEEFDEFFDINLNFKLEEKQKELEASWYEGKSPAWKYVAQYAEKVDHPSKLVEFIQGVQNIDNLSTIDENTVDGAEQVYRTWLTKRGEPAAAIEKQVELAKNSDQLVGLAATYKPILVQHEQKRLADMDAQEAEQEQRYLQIITDNRNKALEAIETPIFGKQKLKEDEKALIYDLIGVPKKELGGYGLYNEIDNLFKKQDFQTLREISLLLAKKDSYLNYASNRTKEENAAGLMRTLKVANTPKSNSSAEEAPQPKSPVISRQQYVHNNGFTRRPTS